MILVTGGTGLVGNFLLRKLVKEGKGPIRATKRENSDISSLEDIRHAIEWVDAGLDDISGLSEAMQGVEQVYHSAAHISMSDSDRDILHKVNAEGTANVVNAALGAGVKRLLYVSSIAAIGANPDKGMITETSKWEDSRYITEYGISKMLGEREVWRGMAEGLSCVVVNPGIILGPAKWYSGSGRIWWHASKGSRLYTNAVNGYIDVRDVVDIMVKLMELPVNGERYILVAENAWLKDLMVTVAGQLGKRPPHIRVPASMMLLIAAMETVKTALFGGKQLVTPASARLVQKNFYYSNQKIKDLLSTEFIPLEVTLAYITEQFRKEILQQ